MYEIYLRLYFIPPSENSKAKKKTRKRERNLDMMSCHGGNQKVHKDI